MIPLDYKTMICKSPENTNNHHLGEGAHDGCTRCLDALNEFRILMPTISEHVGNLVEHTYVRMDRNFPKIQWIHELNLQELFLFQKAIESLAAHVSCLYDKRTIEEKVPDLKALEKKNESWQKAIKDQKDANRPKVERKHLSDREKAIKALQAVGLSLEAATASVDSKYKELGKVTQ